MKHAMMKLMTAMLLASMLLTPLASLSALAALPERVEKKSDLVVHQNGKAKIDASNVSEGYVSIAYTGGQNVRIKARIQKSGGTDYTYDLNNTGVAETFPITEGDGSYTITVFENISGTKYAQAYTCTVQVTLRNPYLPYLYPNQYVNYNLETRVVLQAAELAAGKEDKLQIIDSVYKWVTANFTYDTHLATTVQSGYLPNLDLIFEKKAGICFDYASVMTAMLRSQGIPCKLVIGYAGEAYHAWINVYIDGMGWLDEWIYFDGVNWNLMDPTFASSLGTASDSLKNYIGDGTNYTSKYAY